MYKRLTPSTRLLLHNSGRKNIGCFIFIFSAHFNEPNIYLHCQLHIKTNETLCYIQQILLEHPLYIICTSFGYHFHIICISNKWDIQQILLEHPLYINWSSVDSPHKRPVTDLWNSLCAWTSCFRNHVVTDDLRQNNGQLQFLKYYRFRNYVILVYGKSMNGR